MKQDAFFSFLKLSIKAHAKCHSFFYLLQVQQRILTLIGIPWNEIQLNLELYHKMF